MATVFEFASLSDFIRYRISSQLYGAGGAKKSNLGRISKQLGYSSPSSLSMVLKGRRLPSAELCAAFFRHWELSPAEREYFRLLLALEHRKRQGLDFADLFDKMRRLSGTRSRYTVEEAQVNHIRNWYSVVIQQLVELPDFKEDPFWIVAKMGGKVTASQVRSTLQELESIGLIVRDQRTNRLRPPNRVIESTHDIPSAAIREHQKGMLNQSLQAIEERPIDERFFNSLTLAFNSKRVVEARKKLREFMQNFNEEFSAESPDSVFQMNFQFFEHTSRITKTNKGGKS